MSHQIQVKKRVSFEEASRGHSHKATNLNTKIPIRTSQSKSKPAKKEDVKKTLIRNVEVPVKNERVISLPVPKECPPTAIAEENPKPQLLNTVSKFAAPELHSTLRVAKEIKNTLDFKSKGISSIENIPPLAKTIIVEKAATKLNFPPQQKLYRDLIPLDVCDDEVVTANIEPRTYRKTIKDKEPKLTDYYTPNYDKEYCEIFKPVPKDLKKINKYDGFRVFNRQKLWLPKYDNCND